MTIWITEDDLKKSLGVDPADTFDDEWLTRCVDAVNAFVDETRKPPILPGDPDPAYLSPKTIWGALQLGTRWYSRRNSTDLSAFAEFGVPPSVDRDIAAALEIDRYFRPAVA